MRKGRVIWLFGPSGAGKTTLARELLKHIDAVLLDGDHMRATVSKDLGFSVEDRTKHLERMAHIAKHLSDSGINVICAFITPLDTHRGTVDSIVRTHMIQVLAEPKRHDSIFMCETRADLTVCTERETVEESVHTILEYLNNRPLHLYIGRFQPFHKGHKALIQTSLEKGIPVLIAIKDMLSDKDNPYSAELNKIYLDDIYKDKDVETIIIPNITAVRYGRKVGYDITKVDLSDDIEAISATEIRNNEDR